MVTITHTPTETQHLAEQIATEYKNTGGVITLSGDLGAGKTTFVQGFAKGLGITQKVTSPTFILMRQYNIPNTQRQLYHLDLYRLDENSDINQLGLIEIIHNKDNVVLIEWPERLNKKIELSCTEISIKHLDNEQRQIEVTSSNHSI